MAERSPLAHSPTLVASPSAMGGGERLEVGAIAGEYVVERFLGAGAMGEVYAGRHPVIGKKVAIKVLRHELASSAEAAERFIREARAVNQIDHPNVIDVFAFGRLDDGRLYLVMDLVEGQSVRKALGDGPLDVETALGILAAVADALDAAHARGVVHRDLKPDNVMLGSGTPPAVHVLDFGIAKLISASDGSPSTTNLTGKGTWLGTPAYMAPEQWSADGAGPASDRYSFGVMAFELLSGGLPFQAASLPAMMEQHFRAPVPALSTRGAIAAHSTFDPVITRAMAKDPDARFATGREMVEALRAAAGRPQRAAPLTRKQWIPGAAGVGVLGLSVAAYLAVRGGGTSTGEPRERVTQPASELPVAGKVRIDVLSQPDHAQVMRDGRFVGDTPMYLDARPGEVLAFTVRKPGYAPIEHAMTVEADSKVAPFKLVPINGFEGVWALPTGDLRAFQRAGETVDVFKLATVRSEREFYRSFKLVPSDDPARIAFATTEEIIDARAPNDPRCHIPHRTQYEYAAISDALEVRREHVRVDVREGHCIILSSELGAPLVLARVDQGGDGRETIAPVGRPTELSNNAKAQDSFDNAFDAKIKGSANATPPPISDVTLKDLAVKQQQLQKSLLKGKSPAKPKQAVLPPVQADTNTAAVNEPGNMQAPSRGDPTQPPPPQQQALPPAPPRKTPDAGVQPRGDSQVVPQQAPQQQQVQKRKL
jgi:tRNA A-37 threonylcarbamoyl transferase component Bud32